MNERIQKLIEQATSTQGPTPYNPLTFEVFDKEKFAQLIVRDCVYMAKGYECALNRDNQLSSAMLEHFGVKE
jgi:hypothetical protein